MITLPTKMVFFSGIFQLESHGDFMGLNGLMHVFFSPPRKHTLW